MVDRPGDSRLWVTERVGYLSVIDASKVTRVLDLSREVSTNGERGLLGIDFSLNGRWLYLSFTDRAGDNRVVEYKMGTTYPEVASRRNLLDQPHPFNAHHGGGLATGPDGLLYIGWGDGESPRTQNKTNAQSLESLLGKILRIQPRTAGNRPYAVPAGNRFVDRPGARPEIFALGLRNPWRFSFDRETGDVWIADVGQYDEEEISYVPAGHLNGANFGWPFLEGTEPRQGSAPDGLIAPLLTYRHGDRCAVIGGYVYRGSAIPALRGSYLYGDLCDNHVPRSGSRKAGSSSNGTSARLLPTGSTDSERTLQESCTFSHSLVGSSSSSVGKQRGPPDRRAPERLAESASAVTSRNQTDAEQGRTALYAL